MKPKNILPFIIIISFLMSNITAAFAQDKIHKTDSTIIEAKVVEIGNNEIKYKKFSNLNGPTYSVSITSISMIIYENGEKEMFNTMKVKQPVAPNKGSDSLKCIENILGVTLENTNEFDGGIRITKVVNPGITPGNDQVVNRVIIYVSTCKKFRVKTTSELTKILYDLYNNGISVVNFAFGDYKTRSKISMGVLKVDISGISKCLTSSEKLSVIDSKKAALCFAKYNMVSKPGWIVGGEFAGMAFGLPGTAAITLLTIVVPVKKKNLPNAPPNVDANAWTKTYKSKIKAKHINNAIIGGVVGTLVSIIFIPLVICK